MNFGEIKTVKDNCETFFSILDRLVESRSEKEFCDNLEMFNNFKAHLDSNIRLKCKAIYNPSDAMILLDELCNFYTEVLKLKCYHSKWVKYLRNKQIKIPADAILDFLEDLGYEMHNKALELKDKKFSLLVNAVAMKGLEIF